MRFKTIELHNFSSYQHLKFDFSNQGLALISGANGSGKSTLCDAIPWVLFGRTAKNGTADEVLSWNTSDDTLGTLVVELSNETLTITRIRGECKDLYFTINDKVYRGKDLLDTQKLINIRLGTNPDAYLAGSYFHEFSQVASFFTTTAKIRRNTTEQLIDLSLFKKLTDNLGDYKKEITKEIDVLTSNLDAKLSTFEFSRRSRDSLIGKENAWELRHNNDLMSTQQAYDNFEQDKNKSLESLYAEHYKTKLDLEEEIVSLERSLKPQGSFEQAKLNINNRIHALGSTICSECGATKDSSKRLVLTKELYAVNSEEDKQQQTLITINKIRQNLDRHISSSGFSLKSIEREKAKENKYLVLLAELKKEVNPYKKLLEETDLEQSLLEEEILKLRDGINAYSIELADVELLLDLNNEARGVSVKNAIMSIQDTTNKLLSDHFDAELRVMFDVKETDKLDVTIYKDGNTCSYTQLSKGQRQLLKLCFGTSVIKQLSNSTRTNVLFFDESLDGLDDNMKSKSFNLFNRLQLDYESVFVVEHNELLKSMFPKRYEVTLINGMSKLEEA